MLMGRTAKVIGFSVPPVLVQEVEQMAKEKQRSKSELFREMVRVYKRYRQQKAQEEDRWVMSLILEAQEEQTKNPMTQDELIKEDQRLTRYGEQQAKKTGLKPKDINHEIHAYRAQRKS
jgi:metal-responsive CopG/Arc/MetJ family transcriptional regulator